LKEENGKHPRREEGGKGGEGDLPLVTVYCFRKTEAIEKTMTQILRCAAGKGGGRPSSSCNRSLRPRRDRSMKGGYQRGGEGKFPNRGTGTRTDSARWMLLGRTIVGRGGRDEERPHSGMRDFSHFTLFNFERNWVSLRGGEGEEKNAADYVLPLLKSQQREERGKKWGSTSEAGFSFGLFPDPERKSQGRGNSGLLNCFRLPLLLGRGGRKEEKAMATEEGFALNTAFDK